MIDTFLLEGDILLKKNGRWFVVFFVLVFLFSFYVAYGFVTPSYPIVLNASMNYEGSLNDTNSNFTISQTQFVESGLQNVTDWNKTYSVGGDEKAYAVAIASTGEIYVVGQGQDVNASGTGIDMWIQQFNSTGVSNSSWNRSYHSGTTNANFPETFYDVAVDSNDNVFAVGAWAARATNDQDWVIKKFNSSGEEAVTGWNYTFNGQGPADSAQGIAIDSNDNIFVVGLAADGGAGADGRLKKFNTSGAENATSWNISWSSAGSNTDVFYDVAIDSNDNVYAVGRGKHVATTSSNDDFVIKMYDTNGTENVTAWNKTFDGNGGKDQANSIAISSDDKIYVVGESNNLVGGSTAKDWWIKKFNASGEEYATWNKTFNLADQGDEAERVLVDSNGSVYVIGTLDYGTGTGTDWWIKKFNSSGSEETTFWNKTFTGTSSAEVDAAFGAALDAQEDLYIVGYATNATSTTSNEDWMIQKVHTHNTSKRDIEIKWYNNSEEVIEARNSSTLGAGNTTPGEDWFYSVRIFDGVDWTPFVNSTALHVYGVAAWTVNVDKPANASYTNDTTPTFNFTINGTRESYFAELFINGTQSGAANVTNGSTQSIVSNVTLTDTNYTFFVNSSNATVANVSTTWELIVDGTYPLIDYNGTGTVANNSNNTVNSVVINVTFTEANFANFTFRLENLTNMIDNTTPGENTTVITSNTTTSVNFSDLADANYSINVSITDLANSINTTVQRYVVVDTTAPTISHSISATTVPSSESVTFSCSASEILDVSPDVDLLIQKPSETSYTLLSDDEESAFSYSDTDEDGEYSVQCRATDFSGNIGTSILTFTVEGASGSSGSSGGSSSSSSSAPEEDEEVEEEDEAEEEEEEAVEEEESVAIEESDSWDSEGTVSYEGVSEEEVYTFDFVDEEGVSEEHNIMIEEVNEEEAYVIFTVESEAQEIQVYVGEVEEVDLDQDGFADLEITVNSITDGVADVTFAKVGVWPEAEEEVVGGSQAWIWGLVALLVLLVAIVVFVTRKK